MIMIYDLGIKEKGLMGAKMIFMAQKELKLVVCIPKTLIGRSKKYAMLVWWTKKQCIRSNLRIKVSSK
jgi:hypothetical protein